MTNDIREKTRAVFLAALMVLSVVAMSATFAGAAAAVNLEPDDREDVEVEIESNETINGQTFYQGQEVAVSVDDTSLDEGDRVSIRQVADRDDSGNPTATNQATNPEVEQNGAGNETYIYIRTTQLTAGENYVIRGPTGQYLNVSGDGFNKSLGNSGIAEFDVIEQTLGVEWEEESIAQEDDMEFTLDSNRGGYDLVISEADEDLDVDELEAIFDDLNRSGFADDLTKDEDDDEITLTDIDDFIDEEDVEFGNDSRDTEDVPVGEYELVFESDDADVETTTSVEVTEGIDSDVDFSQAQFEEPRGGIAEIQMDLEDPDDFGTEDLVLVIGDEDDIGYEVNLSIDPDGEEEVVVEMNTFTAGDPLNLTGVDRSAGPDNIFSVDSPDDDATITGFNVIDDDDQDTVLEPGQYELSAEIEGDEEAVGTLRLTPRTYELNTWTAPDDNDTIDDIQNAPDDITDDEDRDIYDEIDAGAVTQTDQVAIGNFEDRSDDIDAADEADGDYLIVQIQDGGNEGVYEYLVETLGLPQDVSTLEANATAQSTVLQNANNAGNLNEDELYEFSVEQDNPTANNREWELRQNNKSKITTHFDGVRSYSPDEGLDENTGNMFLIMDTDEMVMTRGDPAGDGVNASMSEVVDDPSELEVQFNLTTTHVEAFDRDEDFGDLEPSDVPGGAGEEESREEIVELVDREVSFEGTTITDDGNELLRVTPTEETVTGTTSVAPATDMTVRARATGDVSFLETDDVLVDSDRTFEGLWDFSPYPAGTEFEVTITGQSFEDDVELDGEIIDPEAANFVVSDLSPTDVEVEQGDLIDVSATVTNEGGQEDTQTVEFRVGGSAVASEEVTLAPGDSTTVEFTDIDTSDLDGEFTHGVFSGDTSQTATLTVNAPAPATFEVSSLEPSEATVTQGDTVEASATITNSGEQEGTQTVEFQVDGNAVASEDVTLAGGDETTVEFSVDTSDLDPGDYEHAVVTEDGDATGSLTVEAESTPTPEPDDGDDEETPTATPSEEGPGFGVIVALLAFLGAALLAVRRQVE